MITKLSNATLKPSIEQTRSGMNNSENSGAHEPATSLTGWLALTVTGLLLAGALTVPGTSLAGDETASEQKASKGFHIGPPGKGITFGGGKGLQIGTDNAGIRINGDGVRLGTDKSGVKIDGKKARVGTDEKGLMIGGGEGVRAGTSEQGVKIDGDGARAGSDSSGVVIDGDGVDVRGDD